MQLARAVWELEKQRPNRPREGNLGAGETEKLKRRGFAADTLKQSGFRVWAFMGEWIHCA